MDITLNGQSKTVADAQNVADLVGQYCKNTKAVIAELNGHIVPTQSWTTTQLKNGDTVELVSFVGGG